MCRDAEKADTDSRSVLRDGLIGRFSLQGLMETDGPAAEFRGRVVLKTTKTLKGDDLL